MCSWGHLLRSQPWIFQIHSRKSNFGEYSVGKILLITGSKARWAARSFISYDSMTIGSEGSSCTKAFTVFIYARAAYRKEESIMSETNANTELSLLPSLSPFGLSFHLTQRLWCSAYILNSICLRLLRNKETPRAGSPQYNNLTVFWELIAWLEEKVWDGRPSPPRVGCSHAPMARQRAKRRILIRPLFTWSQGTPFLWVMRPQSPADELRGHSQTSVSDGKLPPY